MKRRRQTGDEADSANWEAIGLPNWRLGPFASPPPRAGPHPPLRPAFPAPKARGTTAAPLTPNLPKLTRPGNSRAAGSGSDDAVMERRRVFLLRTIAWALSPGTTCRGTLELTVSGLSLRPSQSEWLLGGFGCRRDLDVPVGCIASVGASSRGAGLRRGWPGSMLVVKLASGRRLLFGVPSIADWEEHVPTPKREARHCPELDARLAGVTRSAAVDIGLSVLGAGTCLGLVVFVGGVVGYPALVALFLCRFGIRARRCVAGPLRRHRMPAEPLP